MSTVYRGRIQTIDTDLLEALCKALDVGPADVLEFEGRRHRTRTCPLENQAEVSSNVPCVPTDGLVVVPAPVTGARVDFHLLAEHIPEARSPAAQARR